MSLKKVLLFVLAIAAVSTSFSCRKNHEADIPAIGSTTLAGTWEKRVFGGPLIDVNPDAFKPGNGNIWSFSDSEFVQRYKDSVYKSGAYTTNNTGVEPLQNRQVQRFIFNGVPSESFELRNDSLYVYSVRTDEFRSTSVYVRIPSGNQTGNTF